jgi:translation initiation factor IF-1
MDLVGHRPIGQFIDGRIVGRLEVDVFIVELADGQRLTCTKSDSLTRSRFETSIGDMVKLTETDPGKGVIFFRYPRAAPAKVRT